MSQASPYEVGISITMNFLERLTGWLHLVECTLVYPTDRQQFDDWVEEALALADEFGFDDEDMVWVDRCIAGYQASFQRRYIVTDAIPQSTLDALCGREQTEQRSAAWYEQAKTILTASELGGLFGSPRLRAQLIMSKVAPAPRTSKSLAVPSAHMSPFDWGIRFEPVVKQIYNHKYGTDIKELGRLISQVDPRCSASPDGLIYHDPTSKRTGRLIEIKCPVTRVPDGKVPKDYYAQIQMQLHVTGLKACDYVEAVFTSPYSSDLKRPPLVCPTEPFHGEILLIRTTQADGVTSERYEYGPVTETVEVGWTPSLSPLDEIMERIPWTLYRWDEQVVSVSEAWWTTTKPLMDAFWVDVERARIDASFLDEHLKKREPKCSIRLESPHSLIPSPFIKDAASSEACMIVLPD